MISRIYLLIILIAGFYLSSCSSGVTTDRAEIAPADTSAYNLGREHALYLMDSCKSEKETCRQLLEMHTVQSSIEEKFGTETAIAYEEGVRTMLTERGDTLATILFAE
ncbi:MAG: hypothetical protein K2M94_05025 [Paramuribaculum sp.]|nr:hypothetical protein [Paramuribaculum sp.]